ncbi:cell division protein SepF [Caryophanon tenue]|uniref:Cell division protein SepF n=1 Tax=Caryophanon tenue TaxID=33978 RepID=A0A1C0YK85_9BACL|nr:hypothetical protein A6M13_09830 [Caryophanon tenue]
MSFINKLKNILDYNDIEEDDDDVVQEQPERKAAPKIQAARSVEQQVTPIQAVPRPVKKEAPRIVNEVSQQNNLVNLQAAVQAKTSKVTLVEPRVYAEVKDIADELKSRRSVIVNLHRVEHEQKKRIIDFLSGTVYAIAGDIQRVGADIYLCTPADVEVSGEISAMLANEDF